jgi:DNA (cytosine-5)-methyltransferase 1
MALRPRNVLSLCAGVGGLELGIALALHARGEAARGICYVEREAAAAASLVASMGAGWLHPAPVWSDLLTFDARPWRGLVHILASGDPCQDNSVAGNRAGAEGERFLAPEVVRIADECRPDRIFRENVPGNADGQLAAIVPALERLGYSVAAGIFSSAETGNTMRRERLFILAERVGDGHGRCDGSGEDPSASGEAQGPRDQRERVRQVLGGGLKDLAGTSDTGQHEHPQLDGEPQQSEQHAFDRGHALRCGDEVGSADHQRHERSGAARRRGLGPSDASGPVDGSERPEWRPEPARHKGRRAVARTGSAVAGAAGAGLPRSEQGKPFGSQRAAIERGRGALPPAVIPGPTDSRWIDVLDRWPEFQPALSQEEAESHLRRGIDAMAHRIERLRATGNGVDPVVAAYAFLRLGALHAEARSARQPLLMERAA